MRAFVPLLRWSYGTVRLPTSVPHGRGRVVPHAGLAAMAKAGRRASRVPRTLFPCMPGVCDPARAAHPSPYRDGPWGLPRVRSASAPSTGPISGLHTRPARSPGNASRTPVPRLAHDAGPAWLARPSLSGTCILQHSASYARRTPNARGELRPRAAARDAAEKSTPV